jgi:hypothetical protein
MEHSLMVTRIKLLDEGLNQHRQGWDLWVLWAAEDAIGDGGGEGTSRASSLQCGGEGAMDAEQLVAIDTVAMLGGGEQVEVLSIQCDAPPVTAQRQRRHIDRIAAVVAEIFCALTLSLDLRGRGRVRDEKRALRKATVNSQSASILHLRWGQTESAVQKEDEIAVRVRESCRRQSREREDRWRLRRSWGGGRGGRVTKGLESVELPELDVREAHGADPGGIGRLLEEDDGEEREGDGEKERDERQERQEHRERQTRLRRKGGERGEQRSCQDQSHGRPEHGEEDLHRQTLQQTGRRGKATGHWWELHHLTSDFGELSLTELCVVAGSRHEVAMEQQASGRRQP